MTPKDKIGCTFLVFCVLFLLILGKAFYVQVIIRDKLMVYSNGQLIRENIVYPKRGNIYDRNGSPLAINIQTYSIFTIPKKGKEQLKHYRKLTQIVPQISYGQILKKISSRGHYTWLVRKIKLTPKQIGDIEKLENIYISPTPSRYYPNNELFSQALGFVGVDNVGLSGVEFKFNKELKGEAQLIRYLRDAKGRPIKYTSTASEEEAKDIYLSIEKDLQAVVEKYLQEAVIENGAVKGGIGIMNADTGEVLALANYPTFDPNHFKDEDLEHRKLAFVTDPFEPGSIFKIFTVASALENRMSGPDTYYYCEKGKLRIGQHVISEAETHEQFEWLSVKDIIKKSSNIGAAKIAFDLTFPVLRDTLKQFKLLEKTGIEIPGESRGIFNNKENIDPLTLSNIGFGQGVATTGIQILSAYATIANGGNYIRPTVLKRELNDKIDKERVVRPEVAMMLQQMLYEATESGTGFNAKIRNFRIAGKTGTAQRPNGTGKYEGYVASFVGFALDYFPKFVVMVYIDDPKGSKYYGNQVAAPVFQKVMQYLLYKHKSFGTLAQGDENHTPALETVAKRKAVVRVLGDNLTPNFLGLDKLSAEKLVNDLGLEVKIRGVGLVVAQKPVAGEPLQQKKVVELNYAPPRSE